MSVPVSLRLPDDMIQSLKLMCQHYDRNIAYFIKDALKSYIHKKLDEMAEREEEENALQRMLNHDNEGFCSHEQVVEFLKMHRHG